MAKTDNPALIRLNCLVDIAKDLFIFMCFILVNCQVEEELLVGLVAELRSLDHGNKLHSEGAEVVQTSVVLEAKVCNKRIREHSWEKWWSYSLSPN